ncbi:YchJ family protein [Mycobacterium sp. DL592]|uniref:YchJ family protein n=1 Tax=Mycobacterium sp. DL592 TaxID=2675524 RepID=UPI001422139D|nr:YchJ family metal-binding protein [Mycobacterium sp. DL592]
MNPTDACPCGSGAAFGSCCLPLHRGETQAQTAEALMRARYSAYAVGDLDYVWQTWHPRTRPATLTPEGGLTWTGLQILGTAAGRAQDQTGEVEFRAHYRSGGRTGVLHERSRFSVRARRWFYVDGDLFD